MSTQVAPNAAPAALCRIQDRSDAWHAFDPSRFDGSQLRYPVHHIARMPPASPAAKLHQRMYTLVRYAYRALFARKGVRQYWETADRADWFDRGLATEVLPSYFEAIERVAKGDITETKRFAFGDYQVVDAGDLVCAMISIAENFTPEIKDELATRRRFYFKDAHLRRALVVRRELYLKALRKLRAKLGIAAE